MVRYCIVCCKRITVRLLIGFLFMDLSATKVLSFGKPPGVYESNDIITSRISSVKKSTLNPRGQCSAEINKLNNRLQQIVDQSELTGHWVSKNCELHAGPKFVLRDYQFYKTGNFLLRQYEYADEQCTKPVFGFTVDGHVVHLAPSWSVPGATSTTFTLNKVNVVPYTKDAAKTLTRSLRSTCRIDNGGPIEWPALVEYKDYPIFSKMSDKNKYLDGETNDVLIDDDLPPSVDSPEDYHDYDALYSSSGETTDFDCTHSANFSASTLNLLRMDETGEDDETPTPATPAGLKPFFVKRLYFGKSVWDAKNMTYLMPSSFLEPLVDVEEAPTCRACDRIKNAHQMSPPKLRSTSSSTAADNDNALNPSSFYPASEHLHGDWLSTSCESYMHGSYGYRIMTFKNNAARGRRWKLRHRYFDDPLCKRPSYTLVAAGHFSAGRDYSPLSSTQRISYKIDKVKLIPESKRFVDNMQMSRQCGPSARWRKGRAVDLTSAGGCEDLGIRVPIVIKDIAKVAYGRRSKRLLLYNGDYTTVEYGGQSYPTSFQPPLTKCDPALSIKLYVHTGKSAGDLDSKSRDLDSKGRDLDSKSNDMNYLHMRLSTSNGLPPRNLFSLKYPLLMVFIMYSNFFVLFYTCIT